MNAVAPLQYSIFRPQQRSTGSCASTERSLAIVKNASNVEATILAYMRMNLRLQLFVVSCYLTERLLLGYLTRQQSSTEYRSGMNLNRFSYTS